MSGFPVFGEPFGRRFGGAFGQGGGSFIPAPANFTITGISGGVILSATPQFTWTAVPGATTYTLQYDTSSIFASPTEVTGIAATNYTPAALSGAKRYARVKATGGAWSTTLTFIIPYIYDSFTAANGTNLSGHTPDITTAAAAWAAISGTWDIQSNQANRTSTGTQERIDVNAGVADAIISVTTIPNAGTVDYGIILRENGGNYTMVAISGSGGITMTLWQYAGGFVSKATASITSLASNALIITLSGTNITVNWNGVDVLTYASLNLNLTATLFGLRENGIGTFDTRFDNFVVRAA